MSLSFYVMIGKNQGVGITAMTDGNYTDNREELKMDLFRRQKQLLDTFLEHGAISRAQYDKSLGDLIVKMGIREDGEEE